MAGNAAMASAAKTLAQRLEYGWAKIDEANERGHIAMANELTDFWLTLEQQYRAAADEINYANPERHAFTWRTAV